MCNRCTIIALVCAVLLPSLAHAQFKLGLEFENSTTIKHEAVSAILTIVNESGKPLMLDEEEGLSFVFFQVTKSNGDHVGMLKRRPHYPRRIIPAGEAGVIKLDLLKYVDMSAEGKYIVKLFLQWGDQTLAAKPAVVDIVAGMEVVNEKRTIPSYDRKMREYSLRYWDRNSRQRLFLRATDLDTGIVQGVFDLGNFVRIQKPAITFDQSGHVKVIHQTSSLVITHTYFKSKPDSVQLIHREFFTVDGRKIEGKSVVDSDPAKEIEGLQPRLRRR